jgi:hypothetical protein
MAEMVELHCEFGDHNWQRPKQKGARPKNCPEHTAEINAAKEEARAARATETRFDRIKSLVESEQHLYEYAHEEERRQLEYIDRVITTGMGPSYSNEFVNPREDADLDLLGDRRTAIMTDISKRARRRDDS